MPIRVERRIVRCQALSPASAAGAPLALDERIARPAVLTGRTYKLKTPLSEHALYLTINDIRLNVGTPYEVRRPFEIFINSKNMEHFQWIVALTRILSAVFRKGGDLAFLLEELRSVSDPRGGYFGPGGRFVPSLVAEIADVLERHLQALGLLGEAALAAAPLGRRVCRACGAPCLAEPGVCTTCLVCGESPCE